MRILPAVMLATTVATARADVLVATSDDNGALFVDQVAPDKVTRLYRETGKGVVAYAFSDGKTLWVLRKDKAGFSIGKVVDDKAEAPRPLANLKTVTPGDEVPTGFDASPSLVTTKQGQVHVATCTGLDNKDHGDDLMHCKLLYRRVDDGSSSETTKRPPGVVFEWGVTRPPKLPAIKKPPADVTARLVKLKLRTETVVGFTCQAKDGKHYEWPGADVAAKIAACAQEKTESDTCNIIRDGMRFTPDVTKVEWLASSPPLVRIEAHKTSPVGEKLHEEHVIAGCSDEVATVQALRDGLWLTDDKVRKPTGEVLGQLSAGRPIVAP
jgi:hypothetical protein